jgi:MFS transporter, YNFM family, putative membrane transport protein
VTCTTDAPVEPVWRGHARATTEYRRVLAALFCAGIATFAQLYSPQAVLPQVSRELSVPASQTALLISVATVGLTVGVVPWSMVSDRIGRVNAMSIAVIAATAVGLLAPLAPSMPLLLTGRLLEGVMVGGVPVIAIAYLTEEIDPRHAARAAGTYVAGTTIGGLTGRLVAGPVAEVTNWRVGIFSVAILCAAAALAFVALVPQPQGFAPSNMRGNNSEGNLRRRLGANLRAPRQLTLYAVAFLLTGGFVALYNFLGFRLAAAPFHLPHSVISLVFLAYLAGTWASARAGAAATRFGRKSVLLAGITVMACGVVATVSDNVVVVLTGLVVATAGFFGAHAIASGWTAREAKVGKAQASSLYNLSFYAGSSVFGWLGGVVFDGHGWLAVASTILALAGIVAVLAAAVLTRD